MKLGFWNRLSLVAGAVTVIVLPTWWALSTNAKRSDVMISGYKTCMAAMATDPTLNPNNCYEYWLEPHVGYVGWGEWGIGIVAATLGVLMAYGIAWCIIKVAKWVWSGRSEAA